MAFADDFSEIASNPGLIAKAIGALLGNAQMFGGALRPGPALSAFGDVLLGARDVSEEKKAAQNIARAAGFSQAPMPPGATIAPTEVPESATSRALDIPLPPGIPRAEFYQRNLSPDTLRAAGKNRLMLLQMEQIADAQDRAAKEAASYRAAIPYMTALHGQEAGPAQARALAQSGQTLSATQLMTPIAEVEAKRGLAEQTLRSVNEQKALQTELATLNIDTSNPQHYPRISALLNKYKSVNPGAVFGSNVPDYIRYSSSQVDDIVNRWRDQRGIDVLPVVSYKDGKLEVQFQPQVAQPGFEAMADAARRSLLSIKEMKKINIISDEMAGIMGTEMEAALASRDPQALRQAMSSIGGLAQAVIQARSNQDLQFEMRRNTASSSIQKMITDLDKELQSAKFLHTIKQLEEGKPPTSQWLADELALKNTQRRRAQMALEAINLAHDRSGLDYARSLLAPTDAQHERIPNPAPQIPMPPGGRKSFQQQIVPDLIKRGLLKPGSPEYATKLEQFRQEAMRSGALP